MITDAERQSHLDDFIGTVMFTKKPIIKKAQYQANCMLRETEEAHPHLDLWYEASDFMPMALELQIRSKFKVLIRTLHDSYGRKFMAVRYLHEVDHTIDYLVRELLDESEFELY